LLTTAPVPLSHSAYPDSAYRGTISIPPAKGTSPKCIFQHFNHAAETCHRWVVSSGVAYETAIGYGSGDLWLDFPAATEPEVELHVLFIGTDPLNAAVYRRKLELDGYRMTVVPSHAQAHESAIRLAPDVIYLDMIKAPGRGRRALHQIRSHPASATIPVVLLVSTSRTLPVTLGRHDFAIPVSEDL
jgi:CheY-like chemotaxis protein